MRTSVDGAGRRAGGAGPPIPRAPMTWSDIWSTGDAAIDRDHRETFDGLDALFGRIRSGEPASGWAPRLVELLRGVFDHHPREEALMERTDYPGLAAHRAEHMGLRRRLSAIIQALLAANAQPDPVGLAAESWRLVIDHLVHHDMLYKSHVMEAARSAPRGRVGTSSA